MHREAPALSWLPEAATSSLSLSFSLLSKVDMNAIYSHYLLYSLCVGLVGVVQGHFELVDVRFNLLLDPE